jgi:hypothetical protein
MPARPGATGGYIIAYAVTLASFIVIWFNHPILLPATIRRYLLTT